MKRKFWIALLPSIFMTQVVTLYILIAPEGLLLPYWTGFGIASAINVHHDPVLPLPDSAVQRHLPGKRRG